MHSPKPPQEQVSAWKLDQQEISAEVYPEDDTCSHVQVIICSCSSHLVRSENIHIFNPRSSLYTTSSPPLPTLKSLLSTFLPAPTLSSPSYISAQPTPSLTAFEVAQVHLQTLNIPSRAGRYLANPFEIPGLLNRTRINIQGLLSIRLLFNIWCVVVWVLVRRFLEIFGVRIGGANGT
ncbi:hypothetical protein BKA65DRAFT_233828 [Rhexocercosporidium sp. MPI-PUGE-AT-0058]|nr:hypothetical protein BKA65DRAFT_233828 [Rhexocercosporidium sp. MPI-PUGE-AT-0058]